LKPDLFARVVDVDADKVPVGIIVYHHPFRNFSALDIGCSERSIYEESVSA
jgi:hypothetical protein